VTDAEGIVANTTYRVAAEIASKVISVAFYVVLAREVGDAGFGVLTFAFSFVAIVTTFSIFGQDAVLIRDVARHHERLDSYFANTLALKLLFALLALGASLGVAMALGMSNQKVLVVLVLGLGVTAEALMATCFAAFQALHRLNLIPVVLLTQRTLTSLVGIPVVVATQSVVAASVVYLACALLAFGLSAALLFRRVVRPALRIDVRAWWPFMRAASPIGLSNVFATTLFRVDVAILAAFATDAAVGDYGAAYRLFEATLFLTWSVGTVTYALFARLTRETATSLQFAHDRGLKLGVIPTLPLAVTALVLGPPLVGLVYGADFEGGGTALMLLAPAIALYPIAHIAGGLLIAQRRQSIVAAVVGVVAAANIAANVVFVPKYSLNAAALITSLSELALAVAFVATAYRVAEGVDWLRVAGGPVFAAMLAGATMLALRSWLIPALAAGVLVYIAVLTVWESRRFPEDARAFSDLLLRRG
jgi:O-antigen/teichoic acid export membrane protein